LRKAAWRGRHPLHQREVLSRKDAWLAARKRHLSFVRRMPPGRPGHEGGCSSLKFRGASSEYEGPARSGDGEIPLRAFERGGTRASRSRVIPIHKKSVVEFINGRGGIGRICSSLRKRSRRVLHRKSSGRLFSGKYRPP